MAEQKGPGRRPLGDKPMSRSEVTARHRAKTGASSVSVSIKSRDALKKIAAFEGVHLYDKLNEVINRHVQEWEDQHGIRLLILDAKPSQGRK